MQLERTDTPWLVDRLSVTSSQFTVAIQLVVGWWVSGIMVSGSVVGCWQAVVNGK